jgi:hypothetical protein
MRHISLGFLWSLQFVCHKAIFTLWENKYFPVYSFQIKFPSQNNINSYGRTDISDETQFREISTQNMIQLTKNKTFRLFEKKYAGKNRIWTHRRGRNR